MSLELIISAAALLVSLAVAIFSYWHGRKSNEYSKKQTELQERVVELEEKRERKNADASKKAKFDVKFHETGAGKKQLRLINRGKCDARNVYWKINSVSPSSFPDVLDSDESINHFRKLRAGSVEVIKIATTKDSDQIWEVDVQWDDEVSTGNQESFELNRLQ